jgi:hypothetical protein
MIYTVEWNSMHGQYTVAFCTSEARAREIFDRFVPDPGHVGWLYLKQYEEDADLALGEPKQLAERRIE